MPTSQAKCLREAVIGILHRISPHLLYQRVPLDPVEAPLYEPELISIDSLQGQEYVACTVVSLKFKVICVKP